MIEQLLDDHHLNQEKITTLLSSLAVKGTDYADLYFQNSQYESWSLEDGIVKQGSYGIDHGVGVRAVSGEKTGFAYSDEISLSALIEAGKTVSAISRHGKSQSIALLILLTM